MPIDEDLLSPKRRSPLAVPLLVVALLGLVGGAFALGRVSARDDGRDAPPAAEAAAVEPPAPAPPPPPPPPKQVAMGEVIPGTDGLRRVAVDVSGSLAASLVGAIGPEAGEPLAQVATRLLVWWLDVSRHVQPNDRLELLYELPSGTEPVVHALRYRSVQLGKELVAYRHRADGQPFARYYDAQGAEIELRLKRGPIESYEQVTSLLRDGRRHKGVDFKAPVGTKVIAPFDGVVKRRNWNYRFNGGSIEYVDGKGRSVIFLHLDSVEVKPGQRVRKGQAIATSGNTGRSFAPHLHYQVMAGGKVLDPFELHETFRVSLGAEQQAAFAARRGNLDALLAGELPAAEPELPHVAADEQAHAPPAAAN